MQGREARYDQFADWYHDWIAAPDEDPVALPLLELVADVDGQRVLDLACGQGRIARHLAARGAIVTGVDLSRGLLAFATAIERDQRLGIAYVEADVTTSEWWDGTPFDGVVASMALMDIDDLDPTLTTVATVLRPGGWFAFSIIHPCFAGIEGAALQSWPTGGTYFDEGWWNTGADGLRGRLGSNHRTLSTYLNGLTSRGFALERTVEPARGAPDQPPMWSPFFLIMRWTLTA